MSDFNSINNEEDLKSILKGFLKKALRKNDIRTYIISTLQDPEFVSDYNYNIISSICGYQINCQAVYRGHVSNVADNIMEDIRERFLNNIHLSLIMDGDTSNTYTSSFTVLFSFTTMPDDED